MAKASVNVIKFPIIESALQSGSVIQTSRVLETCEKHLLAIQEYSRKALYLGELGKTLRVRNGTLRGALDDIYFMVEDAKREIELILKS